MAIKRVLAMIIAVLLCCTFFTSSVNAASVYNRQRKSIHFVLDDSGSMISGNDYDTNYALQTLLAMTDKEDSVKVYFLNSDKDIMAGKSMKNKSNQMLLDIKNEYPESNGGTPFGAVETAERKLKDEVKKDDETEYWLVVLTDGGFSDGNPTANLQGFADETLKNGTKPNVLFISIGSSNYVDTGNKKNFYSIGDTNVIKAMNEAADIITGRQKITDAKYSDGNNKVTFTVPYPAKNIIILTQNKKTKITNVQSQNPVDTSENYTVTHPNSSSIKESTVCFINYTDSKSIPMGEMTLTFDKAVVPENTTILFEPAIGLKVVYFQEGQQVDPVDLQSGATASMQVSICDSITGADLSGTPFGQEILYAASVNGTEINNSGTSDKPEYQFEVPADSMDINLQATLPDGYVLKINNHYDDIKVFRRVDFSLSNGGSFVCDFDKLSTAEGIDANILINGQPPTAEQLKLFRLDIEGENLFASNFKIEKDEANGKFIIHPKKGLISVLTPLDKTYKVNLIDSEGGKTYTADLRVEIPGARPWLTLLFWFLILLLLIYLIIVFATKRYFPRGLTFLVYFEVIPSPGEFIPPAETVSITKLMLRELKMNPRLFFKHMLIQLLPNQAVQVNIMGSANGLFSGITLKAGSKRNMFIKSAELYKDDSGSVVADFRILESDFEGENDLNNLARLDPKEKEMLASFRVMQVLCKDEDGLDWYMKATTKRNIRRGVI